MRLKPGNSAGRNGCQLPAGIAIGQKVEQICARLFSNKLAIQSVASIRLCYLRYCPLLLSCKRFIKRQRLALRLKSKVFIQRSE